MNKELYTNYRALDFAQDPSFIRYAKNSDPEATAFWENWLEAHPDKQAEVSTARQLVQAIRVEEVPVEKGQIDQLWSKIHTEINRETPVRSLPNRRRIIQRWVGVAAAVCVGFAMAFYFYLLQPTVQTLAGEQRIYYLPDSSMIRVNAGSDLVFDEKNWAEKREIRLQGEAFFNVKKGSRFQVKTDYGVVTVLGTSFNVYAREDAFAVDCFTGKVEVKTKKGAAQILTPGLGTQLTTTKELSAPDVFEADETATWRQGEFYYKGAKLDMILAELERQFDVQIKLETDISQKVGTIYFNTMNLDSALYRVTWPMGLEAERKGKVITIR